ncbi:uncharacterized protein RCC_06090 [Ramularia collo-cygni]|uniref:Uncharacterized protein n=1 Tax=Ramularia collo-cygni TaxID=112498 RepID=A0A2D3VHK0_9PEZI|nr:uncharacterized protein RCC_06090 [Ramularia collo-cygni]CZT20233.1 uncharacterized protein RCC_06090 [Ramularia collo-cygni]
MSTAPSELCPLNIATSLRMSWTPAQGLRRGRRGDQEARTNSSVYACRFAEFGVSEFDDHRLHARPIRSAFVSHVVIVKDGQAIRLYYSTDVALVASSLPGS